MIVQSVQVKRRRIDDPLDVLVVRSHKRSRDGGKLVYRRAQTWDLPTSSPLLLEAAGHSDSVFSMPKLKSAKRRTSGSSDRARSADEKRLREMVSEYLMRNDEQQPSSQPPLTAVRRTDVDDETEDYVYDVYYSDLGAIPDKSGDRMGYIDVEEEMLMLGSSSEEQGFAEDDEDSNAEDFYQNDYPDVESDDNTNHTDGSWDSILGDRVNNLVLDATWSEDDHDEEGGD